jgi:hypothetical protein
MDLVSDGLLVEDEMLQKIIEFLSADGIYDHDCIQADC